MILSRLRQPVYKLNVAFDHISYTSLCEETPEHTQNRLMCFFWTWSSHVLTSNMLLAGIPMFKMRGHIFLSIDTYLVKVGGGMNPVLDSTTKSFSLSFFLL